MRKNESGLDVLFDLLTTVPAWVGPAFAVFAYAALRYLIPWLSSGHPDEMVAIGRGVQVTFMQAAAPFVSAVILLVWLMAEIKKWVDRRRLDKTNSIDDIRRLSWREFERLVAEAYRRKGYAVEETGSASGDGGVDLILHAAGERTLVQCKHWKERQVGVKVVRELYGVMHDQGTTRGIIVCFGSYTQEARDFAERNGIELVTGHELERLISEVKASPGTSQAGQGPKVSPVATESAAERAATAPLCPVCGSRMVLRTAQKGPNAGSRFWGCPQYPRCRGKRPLGV